MSDTEPKNKSVEDGPVLREHVYDGIQEYDQKLPNWWLASWYIFIVLFVVYWVLYYQFDFFPEDKERLQAAVKLIDEKKASELEKMMTSLDDKVLWEMSKSTKIVAAGKATFQATCVACHGNDLSGMMNGVKLPGESLKDDVWKYGGKPMEVFKIVKDGSPDVSKGMVAWEPVLGPKKVAELVAFIMSHHQASAP
jgi:cytochrome c oxidase cbb3-type subunit 3